MRHGSHLSLIQNTWCASRSHHLVWPGETCVAAAAAAASSESDVSLSRKEPYVLLFQEIRLSAALFPHETAPAVTSKKNVEFTKVGCGAGTVSL